MSKPYSEASRVIRELRSTLSKCDDFFTYRDRMNATLHLSETRWSPMTLEVRSAIEKTNDYVAFGERI